MFQNLPTFSKTNNFKLCYFSIASIMVAVALFNALHSFPKTTKPFVNYCDKLTELIIKISFGINSTPAVTSKVVYPGWTLTINSLIHLIV